MEIKHVISVLVLAKHHNFTKAATELYISQPALSSQISILEAELGVALFKRTTHAVTLTENGKVFCEKAKKLMKEWEELQNCFKTCAYNRKPIKIGITFSGLCSPVITSCINFFDDHPEYEVSYVDETNNAILSRVSSGEFSAALCRVYYNDEGFQTQKQLKFIPLIDDPPCFIMSKNHPLAERESLDLSELQNETMITGLDGSNEDNILRSRIKDMNLQSIKLIRTDNMAMIITLLKEGKGIIQGPKSIADYYDLAAVTGRDVRNAALALVYPANNPEPIFLELRDYLKERYTI